MTCLNVTAFFRLLKKFQHKQATEFMNGGENVEKKPLSDIFASVISTIALIIALISLLVK